MKFREREGGGAQERGKDGALEAVEALRACLHIHMASDYRMEL
jgi:hypothetical protein